jgi:DinB superfamily
MGYVEENDRERARLASLVARLDANDLARRVNDEWTVAGVLAHVAFWDGRNLFLAHKLARGEPFSPSDEEPQDVTWINDAGRPLLLAIEAQVAARLALQIAEETDAMLATLPAERMYPVDPTSLVNPFRAPHRAEHLDEIEAMFGD